MTRRHGRRTQVLLLLACLVIALGTPAVWWATRPPVAVGQSVAATLPVTAAPPTQSAGPALPRFVVARPESSTAGAPAQERPVTVTIPAVGLNAPVDPVGVTREGAMELPGDVERVGWYRFGPVAGADTGTTVIAGHVDGRKQGLGAMAAVRNVAVGAAVSVTAADGTRHDYRVIGRERIVKKALPVQDLFRRDGAHRLVLITCGGAYDRSRGGYQENIVVLAVPT